MVEKKATGRTQGHSFTAKETANGLHESSVQEHVDAQLIKASSAVHQYVTMIAAEAAHDAGIKLPTDYNPYGAVILLLSLKAYIFTIKCMQGSAMRTIKYIIAV